jgi:hypothetical protein
MKQQNCQNVHLLVIYKYDIKMVGTKVKMLVPQFFDIVHILKLETFYAGQVCFVNMRVSHVEGRVD